MYILIPVIALITLSVAALEDGAPCLTPNGENATCISIYSCRVITQAITYLNKDAIEFAKQSQCGFKGKDPLVCCGSTGHPTTPAQFSTPTTNELFELHRPEISTEEQPETIKPIENVHLPDSTLCGIQNKQSRIVGGTITEIDEFPWMVTLKYTADDGSDGGYRCGGTLITNQFVLTAAQCLFIKGFNLTAVRLGEWRFSTQQDCIEYGNEVICTDGIIDAGLAETIPHPFYSKRSGNNDIALLQLDQKIKYGEYIRPICLPSSDLPPPKAGTLMDICGWGITENGTLSDIKMKTKVPMVGNKKCEEVFTDYTHVNPNQACAGGEGGKDACKGDSGGPLMRTYTKEDETAEEQWFQEGIIYRGLGCGRKDVPSLYTRVSRYTYWILNNLK